VYLNNNKGISSKRLFNTFRIKSKYNAPFKCGGKIRSPIKRSLAHVLNENFSWSRIYVVVNVETPTLESSLLRLKYVSSMASGVSGWIFKTQSLLRCPRSSVGKPNLSQSPHTNSRRNCTRIGNLAVWKSFHLYSVCEPDAVKSLNDRSADRFHVSKAFREYIINYKQKLILIFSRLFYWC
jgi:hypothetical protein